MAGMVRRGARKSAETRTKIGDRLRGRPQSDDHKAALSRVRKGASRSPEMRAKISATLSGREKSPDHCKAVSLAKKGKSQGPLSAEHRAAIGRAHTGKKRSDEAKAAMRVAQAKVDATQKSARITAALTGKKLSDEHRAKISEVQKGRKRSPEFKARVSAGMKALRAKQKAEREAQLVRAA